MTRPNASHLGLGPAFGLLAAVAAFAPLPASADVIRDDEAACRSAKAQGDACTLDGKAGACAKETCSRLDYSNGSPPSTSDYDCYICKPGMRTTAEAEAAKAEAKSGGGDKKSGDKKSDDKSGCRSGGPLSVGTAALGVVMLLALSRRRRED